MHQSILNRKLAVACQRPRPALDEIKHWILAGADTNQRSESHKNIFEDVFPCLLSRTPSEKTAEAIKDVIQTMVSHGWDIKRFGLSVMDGFLFSTYDRLTFDLYRFFLRYDLVDDSSAYQACLNRIATEESYQRCCEENPTLENLFYTIFEMVLAKSNGRSFEGIGLYQDAIGQKIDGILCFCDANTPAPKTGPAELNADIGFLCGKTLLVLQKSMNLLCMNERIAEQPQTSIPDLFGSGIIGSRITDISFTHQTSLKGASHCEQPALLLELDCGKRLRFTRGVGSAPFRFSVEQMPSSTPSGRPVI